MMNNVTNITVSINIHKISLCIFKQVMKLIAVIFVTFLLIVTSESQFTSVCDNRVISDVSDTGGICYEESLATDMRDWNSAFNNCSSTNRRLARVLNEEMSAEIERITQSTDEYWIGLSRPDSNSEFMWSDGTSVSYTRWSSGHPIDGLNCVSVRGDSTEWYSSDCSDVKRYVCERDVCVGWTVRNGICYKTFDPRIDVDAAISVCQSHNAYLAEIPNIYVDNVITEIVREVGEECWIGLRTNATHYYWRIGDFSLGNDTPTSDSNRNCGAVDGDNGNRWTIINCFRIRCTICMIGPLTNEIPIKRCENSSADTLVYEDSCYTRITVNERNLDRATLTCTDYYNGTLYDLSDTTVNEEIRRKFGNGSDLSIVDPNEYRFTAQDGYFNLYTSFEDSNYPKLPDCVRIDSEGILSNSTSNNCSGDDRNYICKRARATTSTASTTTATTPITPTAPTTSTTTSTTTVTTNMTTTTTTTTTNPGQFTSICENRVISDVNDTGGICYEESLATDMRDWNSAFNNCSSTNRRLARVLNEEMSAEIERITQSTDEYWIGLYRSDSNSMFMWSDGTNVSYTRWSSGHPIVGLNCVSVRGDSTEWFTRNCSDVKRYVCERDVCVGWTVRNGICYKTFDPAIDADTAISFCQSQNAYLAEIPNIYVDNVITEIIGDLAGGLNEHWIGLRTNDTHYYWRTGDFSLGNDTLSDIDRNECGAVDGDNGNRWRLRNCYSQRRTICMIGTLTNEIPIERCENSSADTLVYEDSCYTLITVDRRNLDRVTLTCTDYYNGTLYDLSDTTVNEEIWRKFGNGSDLSIVDPNEYSEFTAQDGYFNLYTSYEDNDYPINPNCVIINSMGGLSSSGNCPGINDRSYICKRAHVLPTAVANATTMSTSTATSMTTNMSTSTPTSMTTNMSTSTPTSMTTNMSTSTPTMNTEIDCFLNPATAVCDTLLDLTYEPIMGMDLLIQIEMSLEMLSNSTTIGTGQIVRGFNENLQAEILVTKVDSSKNTTFGFDGLLVEINDQSFENDSTMTSAVYTSNSEFISGANIVSQVITIITSERLVGSLTMIFSLYDQSEATLMCSSYTDNSTWISDGIITNKMETTIACTTNHLTTFAVTQVITITSNKTVDCSDPDSKNTSFCNIIQELPSLSQSANTDAVQLLQDVDVYLESLVLLFNITTGVKLEIVQPQQVLVIIGLRRNSTTLVEVGDNAVTANPNSFAADTVLAVLSTTFNDTREFTNDSVRIMSDIITMQASNDLNGDLTIQFIIREELNVDNSASAEQYYCAFLESDGTWSTIGITTTISSNNNVDCVTEHLTTFALLSSTSICDVIVGDIDEALLQATSYTLLSISLLFLIASIITFIFSWKQVFRIDINVLNFNHSIALSLAILVSIFGAELFSKHRIVCHGVAFLNHFLWTNVFLSSLSISILVFYSIWIVGLKHIARKLSPYLITISWTTSCIWALACLAFGMVNNNYINSNTDDNSECNEPCILSTHSQLIYALIVPVIVIIAINLFILLINLLRIRQVFKNKDRSEKELVRLRRVALGGLLLVPSLGLPFLLSIPLSFSNLYKDHIQLYLFFQWANLLSTATIGILHFLLVTYQTPEVRLPNWIRTRRGKQIATSVTSTSPLSNQKPAPLKLNIVRKKPKIEVSVVIENENFETKL